MSVVLRFLSLMKGRLGAVLLGLTVSILASLSSISLMAVSGFFIADMAIAGAAAVSTNIFTPAALIRLFAITRTLLRYADRYFNHDATFRIVESFRLDLFRRAVELKYEEVRHFQSADLERRLKADTDSLEKAYIRQFMPLVCAFVTGGLTGAWFMYYDLWIAVMLFAAMLLSGAVIPLLIAAWTRKVAADASARAHRLHTMGSDLVMGLYDLILMNKAHDQVERFKQDADELARRHARLTYAEGLSSMVLQVSAVLTFLGVLLLGMPLLQDGRLQGADMIMLAVAAMAVYEVINPLAGAFLNFEGVRDAAGRVFALVDNRQAERTGQALKGPAREVVLEDVTFHYEGTTRSIIDHLSLTFSADSNYLIRGRSGRGKTTLLNLITALLEPQEGRILLNGIDYRELGSASIRSHFATATQELTLFSGTIRSVFTDIRPEITDEEIHELLDIMELGDFVRELPEGLEQFTGHTGLLLSGGQARRLCVARALCRECDFLILDEPTEGLDRELEIKVVSRLLNLRKGIIMISHKTAGQELVDHIIDF